MIDAATAAGVAQLVYTGVFGGPSAWFALADDHRETEQLIVDSGLPHTFLRNNWYSEMYTGDVAGIVARGAVANAVEPGEPHRHRAAQGLRGGRGRRAHPGRRAQHGVRAQRRQRVDLR